MSLLSTFRAVVAAIKGTTSGEVEYSAADESLPAIHEALITLLNERGIPYCADTDALQALGATEAMMAWLDGAGMYLYSDTDSGNSYQSIDGGFWNRALVLNVTDMLDVDDTAKGVGKTLIWNGTTHIYSVPTVLSLGWSNISSKPTLITKFSDNIGVADSDAGNVQLLAQASTAIAGTNSIVIATPATHRVDEAVDSVIIANNPHDLNVGVDAGFNSCAIVGDPGDLSAQALSDVFTNILALGVNGVVVLMKDKDGRIHVGAPAGSTTAANTLWGTTRVTGAATLDSTLAVAGALTAAGAVNADTVNVTTGIASPAGTILALNIGNNSTAQVSALSIYALNRMRFPTIANYASNAAALAGGLVIGDFYRNGDNVCVVH